MELVGRENEIDTFKDCLDHSESRLIAVYGRRRVGKTFLIRSVLASKIVFEVSGLYKGKTSKQIKHFTQTLAVSGYTPAAFSNPKDWIDVFGLLKAYLDTLTGKQKKVIFLDELPWFDTARSQFLTVFENFWNQYCSKRNDIIVVICGSAASYMIKKILKNKGGLHNRVHAKIHIKPFNLYETEKFLKAKGIVWDQYTITQLYMCTGGIPFYLDSIRKGESLVQFINRSFFREDGLLNLEYNELYTSLFDESANHRAVVEFLAKHQKGVGRDTLATGSGIRSGGTLTKVLDELSTAGFLSVVSIDTNSKFKVIYKLEDFYTLFYLNYVLKNKKAGLDNWQKIYASSSWVSWSGFAFERICFYHTEQIKKALHLTAIDCKIHSWKIDNDDRGAQIDMVIDRADRVVNIVEMKFWKDEYTISKDYAKELRNKMSRYAEWAPKKVLMLTMISSYGILENEYYKEIVQNQIRLKQLFLKN